MENACCKLYCLEHSIQLNGLIQTIEFFNQQDSMFNTIFSSKIPENTH